MTIIGKNHINTLTTNWHKAELGEGSLRAVVRKFSVVESEIVNIEFREP